MFQNIQMSGMGQEGTLDKLTQFLGNKKQQNDQNIILLGTQTIEGSYLMTT